MRRLISLLAIWFFLVGAAPSRTQTYTAGEVISPSEVTENEDNIYNYLQAGVDTYATGSVTSAAIQDNTVAAVDIATSGVATAEILNGTILSEDISDGTITTSDIAASTILNTDIADADHGDFTYSSNTATLDNDVVAPAEMADADHGDFTYASGSATLDAGVVNADELAATLTLSDGDILNMSAINVSGTGEGLILPQTTSCTNGTAEGQVCWDSDDDALYVGDGSAASRISDGSWLFVETLTLSNETTITTSTLPTDADIFKFEFDLLLDSTTVNGSWTFKIQFNSATAQNLVATTTNVPSDLMGHIKFLRVSNASFGTLYTGDIYSGGNDTITEEGSFSGVSTVTTVTFPLTSAGSAVKMSGKIHVFKLSKQ